MALGIIGIIGVAFLAALTTASKSTDVYEQRATALNLAQSQLEYIIQAPYADPPNYTALPQPASIPANYTISISTVQVAVEKQEVTVAVSRGVHSLLSMKIVKVSP